jgi:hypothetical protein
VLVVDSSLLVAHLRADQQATTFLRRHLAREPLVAPALVAFELWMGADTARRREAVSSLLDALRVDPFVPAMARIAGELQQAHRRAGRTRPTVDVLIASHALHHRCALATLDRDYEGVQGLDVLRLREEG